MFIEAEKQTLRQKENATFLKLRQNQKVYRKKSPKFGILKNTFLNLNKLSAYTNKFAEVHTLNVLPEAR